MLGLAIAAGALLGGCMTHFDRRVERVHKEYLCFQNVHGSEFGALSKRNDWEVEFWWDHYKMARSNRGKPIGAGQTEPTHGIWATFSGRCMIQEIGAVKWSWAQEIMNPTNDKPEP